MPFLESERYNVSFYRSFSNKFGLHSSDSIRNNGWINVNFLQWQNDSIASNLFNFSIERTHIKHHSLPVNINGLFWCFDNVLKVMWIFNVTNIWRKIQNRHDIISTSCRIRTVVQIDTNLFRNSKKQYIKNQIQFKKSISRKNYVISKYYTHSPSFS